MYLYFWGVGVGMGGGGAYSGSTMLRCCVCRKVKKEVLFRLQVNRINEMLSFKLGMEFASSVCMGENILEMLNVKGSETKLQQMLRYTQ